MTADTTWDLVSIGEAFDDWVFAGLARLPRPGQELRTSSLAATVGGGAVITAVAARRLGLRTLVISALSRSAEARLARERVASDNLRKDGEPTALTVALSTRKDRAFVTYPGANAALEPRLARAVARLRHARHVHLAFCPADCAPWIARVASLRARGCTTSWDFGWNERLRRDPAFPGLAASVDYLLLNQAEATLYARRRTLPGALDHWRRHPHRVVVKLGARGAVWLEEGVEVRERAPRVAVVDTTGAGDAFNAGLIAAGLHGASPRAALRLANLVGALSTRGAGGLDGLPRRRDLARQASTRRPARGREQSA